MLLHHNTPRHHGCGTGETGMQSLPMPLIGISSKYVKCLPPFSHTGLLLLLVLLAVCVSISALSEIKSTKPNKSHCYILFIFRISTVFAILSAGILAASTILARVPICLFASASTILFFHLYAALHENCYNLRTLTEPI